MKKIAGSLAVVLIGVALPGCDSPLPEPPLHSSAASRLRPLAAAPSEPRTRGTVYVPVYSSIELGDPRRQTILLGATLSVRNVSSRHPVVLDYVRYYDSGGQLVRQYLKEPSELPPLATVEFVVQRNDASGGTGRTSWWAGMERRRPTSRSSRR
jgi:hypothetical protein